MTAKAESYFRVFSLVGLSAPSVNPGQDAADDSFVVEFIGAKAPSQLIRFSDSRKFGGNGSNQNIARSLDFITERLFWKQKP